MIFPGLGRGKPQGHAWKVVLQFVDYQGCQLPLNRPAAAYYSGPGKTWAFAKGNALQGAEGSGRLAGLRLDNMHGAAALLLHLQCDLDGICIGHLAQVG